MQNNSTSVDNSNLKCKTPLNVRINNNLSHLKGVVTGGVDKCVDQNDEHLLRTLYLTNLDVSITEDLILELFSQFGHVKGCKIIEDSNCDPYCLLEYSEHHSAAHALIKMNKCHFMGRKLKVSWAMNPGNTGTKPETLKYFHIFVGDLSPEIEIQHLREVFSPFGEIWDCRVSRDPKTLKSKGYGFVSFVKKEDAENAISTMNGQWLGSRAIRTNWATRKPPSSERSQQV